MLQDVYIFDAIRTPRGKGSVNGALQEVKPIQLVSSIIGTLLKRYPQIQGKIDEFILGCMTPVGEQGGNIARAAALFSGLGYEVSGTQINSYCASSLESVQIAAAKIQVGLEDMVLAAGLESLSRVPEGSDGGAVMYDPDVRASTNFVPRAISADMLATLKGYDRARLDAYALDSHLKAINALRNNVFMNSIIPVFDINGLPILAQNECLWPNMTMEELAAFPTIYSSSDSSVTDYDTMAMLRYPSIEYIQHLHSVGNSAPLADGAAVVLLGSKSLGETLGLKPRVRILAAANCGVENALAMHGCSLVAQKALDKAGLKKKDIDLWEVNELFAAAPILFIEEMGLNPAKVNVYGGDIAWGYAGGATGAIALASLLDALDNLQKNIGCVVLWARTGMASAVIVERI